MSERQEKYVTATATPNYLSDSDIVVLTRREREFIEQWRKNPAAQALAVDHNMARLWNDLCRLYAQARKHDIEPVISVDMMRLKAYTLNEV